MIRPAFIVLLAAALLAGCDPRFIYETNLSPRELQALTGTWEGQSALSKGDKACPAHYLWFLRVANGNVDGSLVDKETPNAPRTRFTTFLDYDGSMTALVRPGGWDATVRGTFQRDVFIGESTGPSCNHRMRLRRTSSS